MTSDQASTSTVKVFRPYWNDACKVLQSQLWLPHQIVSAEPLSLSSSGSSNYTVDNSCAWKSLLNPIGSTPVPFLPSLQASAPVTTENGQVVAAKKIRIFPEHVSRYFDLLSLSRRAYNLTIEWLKAQERVDLKQQSAVRARIREQVRKEFSDRCFVSIVNDEAVNEAFATFRACLKRWAMGKKAQLQFRSMRDVNKSFIVQKLGDSGVFPRNLGGVHVTEPIPEESKGCMASVTYHHGRWFIQVKCFIAVRTRENQARTVALDPGVRTFITAFSPTNAAKYGEGFSAAHIQPLLRKKDSLISRRAKLLNKKTDKQWWRDEMRCVNTRINRVNAQIDDYVTDLHHRVAYELVSQFDTIVCPPFETQQMSHREGRKISRGSVREMQTLRHYQFQQHLKWMCRKYGNSFVAQCEAYTSKTRSWDGVVHVKLGGASTISDGTITVDRDINGARGIFLRAHTWQLTPCSDPNVTVGTN